jgi:hypothetical protein
VTSAPCPVSAYPIRSNESEGLFACSRCHTDYHEPCFWRVLPITEFLAYWRWLNETDDANQENVCAACRQLEGLGRRGG